MAFLVMMVSNRAAAVPKVSQGWGSDWGLLRRALQQRARWSSLRGGVQQVQ